VFVLAFSFIEVVWLIVLVYSAIALIGAFAFLIYERVTKKDLPPLEFLLLASIASAWLFALILMLISDILTN